MFELMDKRTDRHFGHGHFGHAKCQRATDILAMQNAKGGRFGHNNKFRAGGRLHTVMCAYMHVWCI